MSRGENDVGVGWVCLVDGFLFSLRLRDVGFPAINSAISASPGTHQATLGAALRSGIRARQHYDFGPRSLISRTSNAVFLAAPEF